MKLHANARTCPKSRRLLVGRVVEHGWSVTEAAMAAGVSDRTAYRWLRRFREQGEAGLQDRSSAPKRIPHKTPGQRVEAIVALRRLRMTAAEIAELLAMAISTVSAWLKRIGLGRRSRLEPPEPPNRYELARPGQLVHVDVKKLGRIGARGPGHRFTAHRRSQNERRTVAGTRRQATGWEFVHVMVDDHTRLAYAEVFQGKGENARQAVAFLRRGLAFFKAHGVEVERVMSDNGSGYVSTAHAIACRTLGVRHTRIRPRRPRTNGKAERFIQTLLNEWAYVRLYGSSAERERQLAPYLKRYNFTRPHGSLAKKPPGSRLTNQARNYS
jgi:transposase InsO family protein